MSVQIIWSTANGGSSTDEPLDHGSSGTSAKTTAQTVYIRHTGQNQITNCATYIRQFTGTTSDGETYTGDASPIDDYNEIVSWGDATTSGTFGGFEFNFNATAAFPQSSWPTFANKTTADGLGKVTRSDVGISSATAITLPPETGCPASGVIPAGSPNVRFQCRVEVPTHITSAGTRMFEQVLKFTYTS